MLIMHGSNSVNDLLGITHMYAPARIYDAQIHENRRNPYKDFLLLSFLTSNLSCEKGQHNLLKSKGLVIRNSYACV